MSKVFDLVVVSKSVQRRTSAQKQPVAATAEKIVEEIRPLESITVQEIIQTDCIPYLSVGHPSRDLAALLQIFIHADPDEAIDIGTGDGKIALSMAVNVPGCKINTVGDGGKQGKAFAGSGISHNILSFKEDKPWHLRIKGHATFFFLNGMTGYSNVREDFKKCLRLSGSRKSTFIWGKCDGFHKHLTKFLVGLAKQEKVLHITGTDLVWWQKL